ncbi:MAG: CopD family protein, partial [Alphaproteobacteria bacterium]|nr:CopD family protein [Alphaproteobacteria bacterium]
MVAWMAGLLYLPRLFVYHAMAPLESDRSETFKVMERRLQRGIMTPAMLATWGFGLALAATPGVVDWRMGWIWAKIGLVVVLTSFHVMLGRWR